jgi:molybdenum cofactor cytidylyltransferase
LLAAGASARLGAPKQLIRIEGQSLLRRAAESALASGALPVLVVLGCEAELLAAELDGLAVSIVVNEDWREGMGRSLRCGVEALQSMAPQVSALLCMVCDQPRLTVTHLQVLWARQECIRKVIAARHGDRPGVPAIFPAKYLPALAKSAGDKGARSLLGALPETEIELLDLPEALLDLDTPEDLLSLGGNGKDDL